MAEKGFRLRDGNIKNETAKGGKTRWGDINLGRCAVVQALDQGATYPEGININPTGVGGFTQGIFYGMMFAVGKDGWVRHKDDEWIETSHANPEYHQMILGQKALYEDKIKQGLAGISQSVADLELLEHDIRKYEEYKGYLTDLDSNDPDKKRAAMFAIKTIFVDQVDFHAGGGGQGAGRLSLSFMRNNNIMPTIVNDFLEMQSLDDIRENGKFVNMADVEKKMLESKWTLYQHWLGVFRSAITQRLDRIKTLQKSREFTIEQYREWLKPIIARFRLIETGFDKHERERGGGNPVGFGRKGIRTHHHKSSSQGVSYNGWTMWIHKPITNPEIHTAPGELLAKAAEDGEFGKIFAFDKWTQDNLIYDTEYGLLASYPFLRKEWVEKKAKEISAGLKKKNKHYYTWIKIDVHKTVNKLVTGTLSEDTDFFFDGFVLSANAMLAKLLEIEAKDQEFERYIDNILGIDMEMEKNYKGIVVGYRKIGLKYEIEGTIYKNKKEMKKAYPEPEYYLTPLLPKKSFLGDMKNIFGINFWLFKKKGPYEHQFYDRFNKFYLKLNGQRFAGVVNEVISRMKIEDVS